jgi:hypothetical protein
MDVKRKVDEIAFESLNKLDQAGDWVLLPSKDAEFLKRSISFLCKKVKDLESQNQTPSNTDSKRVVKVRKDMENTLENLLSWEDTNFNYETLNRWILNLKRIE